MKNIPFILLALLITCLSFSQPGPPNQAKGINYKALIKDDSNNALSNQNITIEFSILEGPEIDFLDVVYTETHTTSTDANGIVIVNIGEGVPLSGFEDAYDNIDWGSVFGSHFLKVRIDSGSGLTDMGTTEFKAVPYALFAENSNSSGLEAINEGGGTGWRLIGRNPDFYGPIANSAVDLSINFAPSATHGATGRYSTALGYQTTASGYGSFASGINTIASQSQATAIGAATTASGVSSTAMGIGTRAEAPNSTAIGLYNIGGGDPLLASSTDPLFEIGNGNYVDGTNDNRTNALTVLRNGTITAPSFDVFEITDDKALITKEYADANYAGGGSPTGLETIDEGNGDGWRLIGRDPANYGNIGLNAIDLSINTSASTTLGATGESSFSGGQQTTASGERSIAFGFSTHATATGSAVFGALSIAGGINSLAAGSDARAGGLASVAFGNGTRAFGDYSFASGQQTLASVEGTTAMGVGTNAIANFATALGVNTTASGIASTSMGNLSTASGLYATAMGTNTNALGDFSTAMGVGSTADGEYSFATGNLTTAGGDYASTFGSATSASGHYSAAFGNSTQANAVNSTTMGLGTIADTPSSLIIGEYNDLRPDVLFQIGNGTGDGSGGTFRANAMTVFTNGHILAFSYDLPSDKRLKSSISNLKYGLNTILKLNPVSYNWKNRPKENSKTFGLIAQEVQPIINEIIDVGEDINKTLSINYIELIPVLINAIKEQQDVIENQNTEIKQISAKLNQYKDLDQRLRLLETKNTLEK